MDRLAGLEKVIRNEDVEQALSQANRSNPRGCRLTHEVLLWVVLTMGLFTEVPIRTAFKYGRRVRKGELTPTRSSLCRGRQRLGIAPVRLLFQQTVRPLAERTTPGCFYHGFRKMAFDSTTFNVPDTRANEVAFGRPRGGNGDGAFPQVTKLSLVELGTHVEIAFVGNDCHRNERQMVYRLVRHLTPEMLVVARNAGPTSVQEWYETLLWEMSNERTDPRRNRINPRVIKQKSKSKFPKKKPEHRGLPPLEKEFIEAVVMLN